MAQFDPEIFEKYDAHFWATKTRRPGPLVVAGFGVSGTAQQVICEPARDARGRATRFELDIRPEPEADAKYKLEAIGRTALHRVAYSRRGNEVERQLAMGSVSTVRLGRLNHFATTSSAGKDIQDTLREQPTLRYIATELEPEDDRLATRGITSIITSGLRADHRVGGGGRSAGTELLLHRPYQRYENHALKPLASALLSPINFKYGEGQGMHAYEGPSGTPFNGSPYTFPLGASAEDTLAMYQQWLGKRRAVNVAVRELTGLDQVGQAVHETILRANAADQLAA